MSDEAVSDANKSVARLLLLEICSLYFQDQLLFKLFLLFTLRIVGWEFAQVFPQLCFFCFVLFWTFFKSRFSVAITSITHIIYSNRPFFTLHLTFVMGDDEVSELFTLLDSY